MILFLVPLRDYSRVIVRKTALTREMIWKELSGAHAGHSLGTLWVFIHPVIVVLTFMTIFGVVIGAKLEQTDDFPGDYTSYILTGLVPWFVTAFVLGKGPSAFLSNSNLVKQVVFPVEVLPFSVVASSFVIYAPTYVLLLCYKAFIGGGLPLSVLLLPIVLSLHITLMLGVTLILSVLVPFVRDIREFITIYLTVAMYFAPAIYLPQWVPKALLPLLYVNPYSYVVWVYQDVFFFGRIMHPWSWMVLVAMTFASIFGGLYVFNRVKPFLGNVL